MFPHLKERMIITAATSSSDKVKVADNVALINGTDLSPILERTEIKKVG
jgi:protein O-GlcNAc transferase